MEKLKTDSLKGCDKGSQFSPQVVNSIFQKPPGAYSLEKYIDFCHLWENTFY